MTTSPMRAFLIAAGIAVALFMSGGAKTEGIMSGPCIGCAEGISNVSAASAPVCLVPTVTAVAPNSGSTTGGTNVTITGTNFTGATFVSFGFGNAATYSVTNATTIAVPSTPPGGAATVDVQVTTPCGTSATSSADQFTYNNCPAKTVVYLTSVSTSPWALPSCWNNASNTIETIAGGSAGINTGASGGGAGGQYSVATNVALSASNAFAVGVGGTTSGQAGTDSYVCNATTNCASITGTAVVSGSKGGGAVGGLTGGLGNQAGGVGTIKFGGNGGLGNASFGSGGGGGAGGPLGPGGTGGAASTASGNSGGGGGNGGGSAGTAGSLSINQGGNGGNNASAAGGGLGSTLTPCTNGTNGGGGGGANNVGGAEEVGCAGGPGIDFADGTAGSGGGGGGEVAAGTAGGNGGLYGGGGGGRRGAAAANGVIRICYANGGTCP